MHIRLQHVMPHPLEDQNTAGSEVWGCRRTESVPRSVLPHWFAFRKRQIHPAGAVIWLEKRLQRECRPGRAESGKPQHGRMGQVEANQAEHGVSGPAPVWTPQWLG